MKWRFFKCGFLLLVSFYVAEARSNDRCDPVVEIVKTDTTVVQLLAYLAERYNFTLSFPKSLDRPVRVDRGMTLDRLIDMLTKGMNTVLRHERVEGCAGLRLTELTVMPVGEETEFINVEKKPQQQTLDYIYIEDMEQYVTEVLKRERKANVKMMTPEQAVEFKLVKKRLRKELKHEIKLAKKNKSKKEKKGKKDKAKQGVSEHDSDK